MEMVEQQQQSARKTTIKFNEEEDYISLLPDCLLIGIISRLDSTKQAIRTGTLSKRWQHLWPYVSNLIFKFYMSKTFGDWNDQRLSDFVSFVDNALTQCRQFSLTKFELFVNYDTQFESQVNNWIRYAFSCNVQDLDLCLVSRKDDFESEDFVLDQFFFLNSCFTRLRLVGCVIDPTGDVSWSRLKTLCISECYLDEDLIQNICSGCPLLETLGLADAYGYRRLDITSKSVKRLVFAGYASPGDDLDDIVEINAPYVLSLAIKNYLLLWKIVLLNVSSVVEAELDYEKGGHFETTRREEKDEMFKGFILKLRNVKELTIGSHCQTVFTRLKAKGLIFPSNIKYLYWRGPNEDEEDEDEDEDDEYGDEEYEYGDEEDEYGNEEDEDQDQDQDQDQGQDEEDEDYMSLLPDCLLIDIISRLDSTKEAIRTGTLSKRWQHLWPYVSNIIFQFYMGSTFGDWNHQRLSDFVSFVDNALTQCRQFSLTKFDLFVNYDTQFESQVNNWIRYAFSCNVQDLDLCLVTRKDDFESEDFVLDQFFFSNSCFTRLRLVGCVIDPTGDVSWSRLKTLYISNCYLDEDLIQNILSGCPLLETLGLADAYGYRRLDISSKSVKRLVFAGYASPGDDLDDIVEINAPYVLSLAIKNYLLLWKILLLDVSSVVEAELDYEKGGHFETTRREEKDEMFKGFILKLRNVKELTIGSHCQTVFTRLKAKGLIFPSNIKYLYWGGPNEDEEDEDEDEDDEYGDEEYEYGDEEDEYGNEEDEYGNEEDEDEDEDQDQDQGQDEEDEDEDED